MTNLVCASSGCNLCWVNSNPNRPNSDFWLSWANIFISWIGFGIVSTNPFDYGFCSGKSLRHPTQLEPDQNSTYATSTCPKSNTTHILTNPSQPEFDAYLFRSTPAIWGHARLTFISTNYISVNNRIVYTIK